MTRTPVLFVLLLAGCDSGSRSRPLAEAVDTRRSGEPVPVKEEKFEKPKDAEATAKDLLAKMVAAHTGGKPELVEQLKHYRGTRRGKITIADVTDDATMVVAARWPDGYRSEFRRASVGAVAHVFGVSRGTYWQLNGMRGMTAPQPLDEHDTGIVAADIAAEWATMLVPLADPSAVSAVVPGELHDGKPAAAVRIWVNDVPLVVVADPATGCVAKVRYQVKELGGLAPKWLAVKSLQTVNGVKLPATLEYAANSRVQTEWQENTFEFPKPTLPAQFEKP